MVIANFYQKKFFDKFRRKPAVNKDFAINKFIFRNLFLCTAGSF